MKFIYLFFFIGALIFDMIIYFQNLNTTQSIMLNFFWWRESYSTFMLYSIVASFASGFFLAMAIKWFLSSSKDIDDWFDL